MSDEIVEAMARAINGGLATMVARNAARAALAVARPMIEAAAYERAAKVADRWDQPGVPGTAEWIVQGNMLGRVADAIRALAVARPMIEAELLNRPPTPEMVSAGLAAASVAAVGMPEFSPQDEMEMIWQAMARAALGATDER